MQKTVVTMDASLGSPRHWLYSKQTKQISERSVIVYYSVIGFLDPTKKARTNRIKKSNAIGAFGRKNSFTALL